MPFTRLDHPGPNGELVFVHAEKAHGLAGGFHLRVSPGLAGELAAAIQAILLGANEGTPRKRDLTTRLRFGKQRQNKDWRLYLSLQITADPEEILWIEGDYPVAPEERALLTFADKHYAETETGYATWTELEEFAKQLRSLANPPG